MTKCLVSALLPSLISAVFIIAAPLGSVSASEGMSAFNRKEYNEAYRIWRRTPDAPESKYGMGRLHLEGLGGPQNAGKGLSLLNEASNAGYMPATEYLAAHYEKRKDFKNAIRYLEKIAQRTPSAPAQKRLVFAFSQSEPKPLTKSSKYCGALKALAELEGGAVAQGETRDCALAGNPSTMSLQAALDDVASSLSGNPSVDNLRLVAKDFLNPKSEKFNPIAIEKALWTLDPKLSNANLRGILVDSNVTYETCVSLPIRTREARDSTNAYCTLAAIAGSEQAVKLAALNFAKGVDGRPSELRKAAALVKLSQAFGSSKDGVLIRLYSLVEENDWKSHLAEMNSLAPKLSDLTQQDRANQFAFQLRFVNTPDKEYTQEDARVLLRLSLLTENSEVLNAVFDNVKNIEPTTLSGDDATFMSELCKAEFKVAGEEKECKSAKRQPPSGKFRLTFTSSPFSSNPVASPAQPRTAPVVPASPASTNKASPRGVPIDQSVAKCDLGEFDACPVAAKALMGNYPPRGFERVPEEERRKLALDRLERAANAEHTASLAMLYDVYTKDLDSTNRSKARKYLTTLIGKNTPEGRLREQLAILDIDPIGMLLELTLNPSKFRLACTAISLQIRKQDLSRDDEVLAESALNGQACKTVMRN